MARRALSLGYADNCRIERRRDSLSGRRLLRGVMVFLVVAGMGVAHIAMIFITGSFNRETVAKQNVLKELGKKELKLRQEIAMASGAEGLREYAQTTLGLVEFDARYETTAKLPAELVAKYGADAVGKVAALPSGSASESLLASVPEVPGKNLLLSLVESGQAYAATGPGAASK